MPVLDPPHISGPNVHLHGTYTCPTVAYDMDDNPFPMFTGVITWTDAKASRWLGGAKFYPRKSALIPWKVGPGWGPFPGQASAIQKGYFYHGEGIYEGI